MHIERFIKEQIYLAKRRNRYKITRKTGLYAFDPKRIFGFLCVMLGVLLILTKCTTKTSTQVTHQDLSIQTLQSNQATTTTTYHSFIQDFNINETQIIQLHKLSLKHKRPFADSLAIWMVEQYKATSQRKILNLIKDNQDIKLLDEYVLYEEVSQMYSQFIYDLICFPLSKKNEYVFENGWKMLRTYKGERHHYGIDIMDPKNEPGKISIFSITDGTIENVGWNELGGYRVGIRSNGGAYFYYAHLNENPSHLKKGDTILAGDYLGSMGNTGYGEEGTKGAFPVHLHLGIAVKKPDEEEFWINPYYLLRYLELNDFVYKRI